MLNLKNFKSHLELVQGKGQVRIDSFKAKLAADTHSVEFVHTMQWSNDIFCAGAQQHIATLLLGAFEITVFRDKPFTDEMRSELIISRLREMALTTLSFSSSPTHNLMDHYKQQIAAELLRDTEYYML